MTAINKEAREYFVKLYQETKEKADKTTTEKDAERKRSALSLYVPCYIVWRRVEYCRKIKIKIF